MGLSQGGMGEEGERKNLTPGSVVRQLPAILEMPRNGKQSQAGLKASAFPNPSPLFKQFVSGNSCNPHDRSARWHQPYFLAEETTPGQGDSDGA